MNIEEFDLDQIFSDVAQNELRHFERPDSNHDGISEDDCIVCKLGRILSKSGTAGSVVNAMLSSSPKIFEGAMGNPFKEATRVYIAEQYELIRTIKTMIILGILAGRVIGRSEALESLVPND